MYEAIKAQFDSKKTIAKQNYYQNVPKSVSEFYGDIYPTGLDYYHELNPAFLMQTPSIDVLNNFKALTVRDGLASFGHYVLKNFQHFKNLKSHLIIPPVLAPLLPPDSASLFSCYEIRHTQYLEVHQASKVIITGIASQDTIEPISVVKERINQLKTVRPECDIEIFFPHRRNPLGTAWKESFFSYEIVAYIREVLPKNKITFVSVPEVLGQTSFKGYYCLDLLSNNLVVSDSYLNHFIASRGGTISAFLHPSTENTLFELDLSFYHRLQVVALPKANSLFSDMIFYKKQSMGKDLMADPKFHRIILQK